MWPQVGEVAFGQGDIARSKRVAGSPRRQDGVGHWNEDLARPCIDPIHAVPLSAHGSGRLAQTHQSEGTRPLGHLGGIRDQI